MIRVGVDVGGTNTDAVVMAGANVVASAKRTTTADVTSGIAAAVEAAVTTSGVERGAIRAVMVGTTHFTNALVERRHLAPTAVLRLGLPATLSVPPLEDWPPDLREAIGDHAFLAHGGHEYDGREISPLDEVELREIGREICRRQVRAVAICAVFSPIVADAERRAAAIIRDELPDAVISLSRDVGRLGLLERENATAMNACLGDLAERTIDGIEAALRQVGLEARLYVTQNDGTLMTARVARRYPVLTFASGPTNSMRGAAFLSGLREAVVLDVGGTTSDAGVIAHGFPREAGLAVSVGGVRTNFRMPDVRSVGLGGGSLVTDGDPPTVGPRSVGRELEQRALVFGGKTMTATDVSVAAGRSAIGDPSLVRQLDAALVRRVRGVIARRFAQLVDEVRTSPAPLPLVLVGGGSVLVEEPIPGIAEIVRPPHHAVANAVGAAIAEISGEIDRVVMLGGRGRDDVLDEARAEATSRAVAAGADPARIEIVEQDEIPLTYLPSNSVRIRVKAVGALRVG